jgi:hypothetical protein
MHLKNGVNANIYPHSSRQVIAFHAFDQVEENRNTVESY